MTGALSMIMIDQTVVSVALPTMQRDLGLSSAGLQWVVNGYLLVLAVLVALGGRMADLLGAERTFRAGSALFRRRLRVCAGLASSEAWIIAARGLQGVGAGDDGPVDRRADRQHLQAAGARKAMGIYSGVSMVLPRARPLVGVCSPRACPGARSSTSNLPIAC